MISIDEFSRILDDLASELPKEFFDGLNLGISVSEAAKQHPASLGDDLYILGEYFRSQMGQGIVIYYGSFARLHRHLSEPALINEMRSVLRHEFRHHMEGRSWAKDLEIDDERRLREYLAEKGE